MGDFFFFIFKEDHNMKPCGKPWSWCIKLIAHIWGFSDDSVIKNPPTKLKTQVSSLGWADPLEKQTATHSSILAWEILWTEEFMGLQSQIGLGD